MTVQAPAAQAQEQGSAAHLGAINQLGQYAFQHPKLPVKASGKVFLKELLGMTSMEVSLNTMPAGGEMPFQHQHRTHEELYIFQGGLGEFWLDGTCIPVTEGSVVFVKPEGVRAWRNTGDVPLTFIVIQAKQGTMSESDIKDGIHAGSDLPWK